ncbi:MAG: DUF1294 domain-containing protein [Clostridiales bacterium]|nr:DUF1294 domain-containing protein [Clostridiales bacterium]
MTRRSTLCVLLLVYAVLLNLAGFCSMGIDKKRAKKGQWRVKERTLFLVAILGGSIGSILGMRVFRHKTKHRTFVIGMPLILVIQIVGIALLNILQ